MPEDTPRGSQEYEATDAYLKRTVTANFPEPVGEPSSEPASDSAVDQSEPDSLLSGKYKTEEARDEAYRHAQAEMNRSVQEAARLRASAERAERFPLLLDEAENNPEFAAYIKQWIDGGGQQTAAPEPEIPVIQETDEFGVPTGQVKIDPNAMQDVIDARVRAATQEALSAHQQQQSFQQQINQLKEREGLTDTEVQDFMQSVNRPVTVEDMWHIHNRDRAAAQAANRGRTEVAERIRQTQARGPAIGATTGQAERPKALDEQMAEDILEVGRKSRLQRELGI